MGRGKKTCSKCGTEQGVRSFNCIKCGEPFVKKVVVKKDLNNDVKTEIATTLEVVSSEGSTESSEDSTVLEPVDMIKEAEKEETKQFQFKTHTCADNKVGVVTKKKTYERPDIEIERLMKDPEVCRIYPVPAGVKPEKLTAREQAYQVLGLGRTRAKSLLTLAQMEKYWKTVDWKYVAEILGEKVVETKEPEVSEEENKGE